MYIYIYIYILIFRQYIASKSIPLIELISPNLGINCRTLGGYSSLPKPQDGDGSITKEELEA